MDKFLGLPADGVALFGLSILVVLLAFWLHEVKSSAKVVKASKRQVEEFKKLHKSHKL